MGRIVANQATEVQESDFLETAGRMREPHLRDQLHQEREAEIDARTLDRQEAEDYAWREPTNLDAPPARPGYRQKWVRVQTRTEADNINWNTRFRQGWSPRDPRTVPEAARNYTVCSHQNQNVIMVGGSVLCEMPIQKIKSRDQWIRGQNRLLEESITADTEKVSREGMRQGLAPIVHENKIDTTVAGRRRPATMAD